jgi:hypothetical protein
MTPNDLDAYLRVLISHEVGSAAIKLPTGAEIHVSFMPKLPEAKPGAEPTPGGWKTLPHLDDPEALRDDREYKGELPT